MKFKTHGGPAFPFEYVNQTGRPQESFISDSMIKPNGAEQYCGVTVRDYFAAKAMQAFISANWLLETSISELSYNMADAMPKEREMVDGEHK